MAEITDDWYVTRCITCGISFAIPESLKEIRQEKGTKFYCPNGHALSFTETGQSQREKELQGEIIRLKHTIEVLETRVEEAKRKDLRQ